MNVIRSPVRPLVIANVELKSTPTRPLSDTDEGCETPNKRARRFLKAQSMGSPTPEDKKAEMQSIIASSIAKEMEKVSV